MKDTNFYNLLIGLSIINLIFSFLNLSYYYILLSFMLVIISLLFKFKLKILNNINKTIILIFFTLCIIGSSKTLVKEINEEFINKNYNEVYMYLKDNDIKTNVNYEYSDKIKENKVIAYTRIDNKANIVVSNGPNYNKKVIIPNLVNKSSKYVSSFITNNYLNNIEITFDNINNCNKNELISQSIIGTMNRDDKLSLTFCKGKSYKKIYNLDLVNQNKYEAIINLLSNNYSYEEKYEFSNIINKNHIIKTKEDLKNNKITLYISKGKEIIVPNFNIMNKKEIYNWILKNALNVVFKDVYSDKIKKGKYISSNVKEGSKISELDIITMYFSRGELVLPNFSKIEEFKNFAKANNINYEIIKEENDNIKEGTIIKFSINPGSKINSKDKIIVYVSKGKEVVIDKKIKEIKEQSNNNDIKKDKDQTKKENLSKKKDSSILDMFE